MTNSALLDGLPLVGEARQATIRSRGSAEGVSVRLGNVRGNKEALAAIPVQPLIPDAGPAERPVRTIVNTARSFAGTIAVVLPLAVPMGLTAQTPRLVDVGGHRLEAVVAGAGEPVVVLEAGLGEHRVHWVAIQESVSKFTTVVAYSRAGYGRSEPSESPRTPVQVMSELRSLLEGLALERPYVLVGQSLGGVYARVFARQYSGEVAGLVLVDSTHERVFQLCSELSDDLHFWQKVRGRFERDAESIGGGTAAEFEELWKIFRRGTLPEAEPLPDVPMIVLTAYKPDPNWICTSEPGLKNLRGLHAEYFERTTLGAHIVTSESGHRIHADQPGLVVESIRQIVELLR